MMWFTYEENEAQRDSTETGISKIRTTLTCEIEKIMVLQATWIQMPKQFKTYSPFKYTLCSQSVGFIPSRFFSHVGS